MEDTLTLVNRAPFKLQGVWDAQRTYFEPGKAYTFPRPQAMAYRNQNPVMGTEDYYSGACEYKFACKELGDNIKPLGKDFDDSNIPERLNRDTVPEPTPPRPPINA